MIFQMNKILNALLPIVFILSNVIVAFSENSFPVIEDVDCKSYAQDIKNKICDNEKIGLDMKHFASVKACSQEYKSVKDDLKACKPTYSGGKILKSIILARVGDLDEFYALNNEMIRKLTYGSQSKGSLIENKILIYYFAVLNTICEKDAQCYQKILDNMDKKIEIAITKTPMFCDFSKLGLDLRYVGQDYYFHSILQENGVVKDQKIILPTCKDYYCRRNDCKNLQDDVFTPFVFNPIFDDYYKTVDGHSEFNFIH